jgi:phospholipid/cholesterol/gamma-HCH transport system permease protein
MALLAMLESMGRYTYFAWQSLLAAFLAVVRPKELLRQLYHILVGVLPLAGAAGLAIGLILWLQLHAIFQRFEAEQFLPQALALAVTLEFAPIGAGLIVAGRSGASLGAELGSMRLTEQIDALEVLGLSPLRELVGPRVLACMVALPLLTVFMAYLALMAGYGAEALGGTMTWKLYLSKTLEVLTLRDVLPAVLKTVVFGYLIGMTGCFYGLSATGGTEGVGQAATRGVVFSIFVTLVANVFLVRIIQMITSPR